MTSVGTSTQTTSERSGSSAAPGRLRTNSSSSSTFAPSEVLAADEPPQPPPPLKRWLTCLVHRAQAPNQRFRVQARVQNCRFSRLLIGTCSPVPYAAPCGVARSVRPVRCGSATESSGRELLHRAALTQPCAVALITESRVTNTAISISAAMTMG